MVSDRKSNVGVVPLQAKLPVAQYVRMSTEHQKYSIDNQAAEIERYAEARGYEVVQTYADVGKSGVRLAGRHALHQLLSDVESHRGNYGAILVYDVSRWGRFQDPDEAAEIEMRCKRAGIEVLYCAEQFENDGTIGSFIVKTVKRAMAGEYSRELSVKVFAGQSNLIRRGYRQGGVAGYGLRRLLIDESGLSKTQLEPGERKSIATDRIVLVPGPDHEVEIVRRIYRRFTVDGFREQAIASELNRQGVPSELGRSWTRKTVHKILIGEKYIGNNVWGQTSFKFKRARLRVPESRWVRSESTFTAIIDEPSFRAAQAIIATRLEGMSDEVMITKLASLLSKTGYLTGAMIDAAEGYPCSHTYALRFGGLLRAYSLVGFEPRRDYRFLDTNRALRRRHAVVVDDLISNLRAAGGTVTKDALTDLLTVNGEFTASVVIARCSSRRAAPRWTVRLEASLRPDLTVLVRMDANNQSPQDYYILPSSEMRDAVIQLGTSNGISLDAYRFDSLNRFYAMASRAQFTEAT